MKKLTSTIAVTALALAIPATAQAQSSYYGANEYTPHERCKQGEDKRQILGGLAGAVVGGVLGSQVSSRGARSEGSALGAVVGGLAGVGIADKTIDCDPDYTRRHTTTGSYGAYPSSTHSTYPSSQNVYTDRVTYSNHPVYTQPSYGAGAVSYGTSYSTGSTTYPPYNNSGHSYQVSSPSYTTSNTSYQTYPASYPRSTPSYTAPTTYRTVSPTYTTTSYARPVRQTSGSHYGSTHYHGRYACSAYHNY